MPEKPKPGACQHYIPLLYLSVLTNSARSYQSDFHQEIRAQSVTEAPLAFGFTPTLRLIGCLAYSQPAEPCRTLSFGSGVEEGQQLTT
ncbi:hypothetical protein PILCRDRAFT_821878 [Piloderma croceum F 1598]|uniref:Uncharacterized protein n=1 Tax=Piloderma croceum (strain F 1598) TaxID=765440 RepID=A0A0C3F8F2_PILCF|nr:hypothetical protein PILCRDRAFT_821878 [Piloderma croceum F 1598]